MSLMGAAAAEEELKAKVAAIILAGGSGQRFGADGGKQMVGIDGHPMLSWSLSAFDFVEDIGLIVVAGRCDLRVQFAQGLEAILRGWS